MCMLERKQKGSTLRCNMHPSCTDVNLQYVIATIKLCEAPSDCRVEQLRLPGATHQNTAYVTVRPARKHMLNQRKQILFELPSLRYRQSVFCWVTLFWRRLEQTVNVPTQACITSHTRGMREEKAASQHWHPAHMCFETHPDRKLLTKPEPESLVNYFDICLHLISIYCPKTSVFVYPVDC